MDFKTPRMVDARGVVAGGETFTLGDQGASNIASIVGACIVGACIGRDDFLWGVSRAYP